jgi:dienelactone hydrolase
MSQERITTMKTLPLCLFLSLTLLLWGGLPIRPTACRAQEPKSDLAEQLRRLDAEVTTNPLTKGLREMAGKEIRARRDAANRRESQAWQKIQTKADWEQYRDIRLKALRDSLGSFPPVPKDLKVRVTGKIAGDGFVIENLVYESRPGLLVTANLYRPEPPKQSMPGILIIHSHHNPKTQGELQDMGILWARLGCMVLVPDQLGHGERRQHPFIDSTSYKGSFKPGRQDYYFRHNTGMQLQLIGDSLIGWMAWDMMRSVDLLLAKPGIDPKRIILLGAVAGGGDPCAVTAALDRRITAAVPFNFGGPQPETRIPLPDEADFNYAGGGSWESTRNLRLSCRDGFLPWLIVGAVAPRPLVYAHEFAWDRERDPVWKRLQKIYGFYDAGDHLIFTLGRGSVKGTPPESTHCNNIGAVHRKGFYAAFKKWFDIPEPAQENKLRFPAEKLQCVTPETGIKMTPLIELAGRLGAERSAAARKQTSAEKVRQDWARLLGNVEPSTAKVSESREEKLANGVRVHRLVLKAASEIPERPIYIPLLALLPPGPAEKYPVVVAVAHGGKQAFLKQRADAIAGLLQAGVAVCLPDMRGTGATAPPGNARDRNGAGLSATELMNGRTLLGDRIRDLRTVLQSLKAGQRIALWGDSFAPVNAAEAQLHVPLDTAKQPPVAEPLGGLLVMLTALYEPRVQAVYARGGLAEYQSILRSQFCYVPHDAIVPGALTAGDLGAVATVLAPRPLRLEGMVDGLNRRVSLEALEHAYAPARTAYSVGGAAAKLSLRTTPATGPELAAWLASCLK